LGVPDDTNSSIAFWVGCGYGASDGFVDGMELVVACHLFGDFFAVYFKDDEVVQEVEEAVFFKDAFDDDFEFCGAFGDDGFSINRAPRHEPFPIGGEGADSGFGAV
jgi:hypothetical protein